MPLPPAERARRARRLTPAASRPLPERGRGERQGGDHGETSSAMGGASGIICRRRLRGAGSPRAGRTDASRDARRARGWCRDSRRPSGPDPARAEVDVLGVVLPSSGGARSRTTCMLREAPVSVERLHLGRLRSAGGSLPSSAMMCRSRWICRCRAMWLAARLEYWMSFCRFITCQIVSGSGPWGFQM